MEPQKNQYQIDSQKLIKECQKFDWSDTEATTFPTSIYNFTPPENKFKYFKYLRFCLQKSENSPRAFALSSLILYFNMNNYYALMLRKDSLHLVSVDILTELHFVNCLLDMNSKEYQLWNYKKQYLTASFPGKVGDDQVIKSEYKFLEYLLTSEDSKNYHVWDYRSWMTRYFNCYESEMELTKNLLFGKTWQKVKQMLPENTQTENIWLSCNSIWSYRFNLLKQVRNSSEAIQEQIGLVLNFIENNQKNQSAWNYLGGLFQLKEQHQQRLCQFAKKYEDNRFGLNFILMNGSHQEQEEALNKLKKIDPTRAKYYQYLTDSQS